MTCIKMDDLVFTLHEKAKEMPNGRRMLSTMLDLIAKLETVDYEKPAVGGYLVYYDGVNIRGIKCLSCSEEVTFPLQRPYKFCPYCKTRWIINFKKAANGR